MEIAIDTSTELASLAVAQDGDLLAEITWRCGQNHSVQLLPRLSQLLSVAKLDIKSAGAVYVALGPGSFNGLRVGVSTAKGLAFSLGIRLAGIGTLEVAAYPHAAAGLPVYSILPAGRAEFAAASYRMDGGWWELEAPHITSIQTLCQKTVSRTIFCGEIPPATMAEIRERLGDLAVIPPPAARLRRAACIVELGQQRLEAGMADNVATLQPIYLRRPPITIRKH